MFPSLGPGPAWALLGKQNAPVRARHQEDCELLLAVGPCPVPGERPAGGPEATEQGQVIPAEAARTSGTQHPSWPGGQRTLEEGALALVSRAAGAGREGS